MSRIKDFIRLMNLAGLSDEEKREWQDKWDKFNTALGDAGSEMVIEEFIRRYFPEDFRNN